MPIRPCLPTCLLLALLATAGCSDQPEPTPRGTAQDATDRPTPGAAAGPEERPDTRLDTLLIEGMPEPIETRLFRTDDTFPLPFSAYVPADMVVETRDAPDAVRFVGEFGGQRNEMVFVHFVVHPDTVDEAEAVALLRGFEAGRGVPAGRGLEPLAGDEDPPSIPWAEQAYRFRYQAGGTWLTGTAALGRRGDRLFHIIRHYPAEYGDGFGPRAHLILESWRWADGAPLRR